MPDVHPKRFEYSATRPLESNRHALTVTDGAAGKLLPAFVNEMPLAVQLQRLVQENCATVARIETLAGDRMLRRCQLIHASWLIREACTSHCSPISWPRVKASVSRCNGGVDRVVS